MEAVDLIFVLLLSAGLGVYGTGAFVTWQYVRKRKKSPSLSTSYPKISLLKPLKGNEENLEPNLRSFFELDYPAELEIVFSSIDARDPALAIAKGLAQRYPHICTRFVVSDPQGVLNPKVANLRGALKAAQHDLILQTDANVRVPPQFLLHVVSEFLENNASLLSCLVVGVGEKSLGAIFENLELSSFIAPATCFAKVVARVPCVIGKSMLFRASELAELGGLDAFGDVLAEDFMLGQRYQGAGKTVLLSATAIENTNQTTSLARFASRHLRWAQMRAVISKPAFLGEVLVNLPFVSLMVWIASGRSERWALVGLALCAFKACTDGLLVRLTRGTPMKMHHWVLSPFKDVLRGLIWLVAVFKRTVHWRGYRFVLGPQSKLIPRS